MTSKQKDILKIFGALVVLAAVGFVASLYVQTRSTRWETYRNEKFQFAVDYPVGPKNHFKIQETDNNVIIYSYSCSPGAESWCPTAGDYIITVIINDSDKFTCAEFEKNKADGTDKLRLERPSIGSSKETCVQYRHNTFVVRVTEIGSATALTDEVLSKFRITNRVN